MAEGKGVLDETNLVLAAFPPLPRSGANPWGENDRFAVSPCTHTWMPLPAKNITSSSLYSLLC